MRVSRRCAFLGASAWVLTQATAHAENVTYEYDELGRLIRVTYANGTIVAYTYDAAGNRQVVAQNLPGSAFTATLPITGTGPINLRTVANRAGYNGAQNATITFEVGSGVTISGAPGSSAGGIGIDTGTWPGGFTTALGLIVKSGGVVRGGGGRGGNGGGAPTPAPQAGGAGGDAIYLRINMTGGITVQSGGTVQAGGGGGGGGVGVFLGQFHKIGGGSGGGGRPNGSYGTIASGMQYPASTGTAGTPTANGVGGAGGNDGSEEGGAGGNGGTFAAAGSGSPSGGAGGAAGFAIRKNGFTATVTNSGTITGTVG